MKLCLVAASLLSIVAMTTDCKDIPPVVNAVNDIGKIVVCVDVDLNMKNMSPADTAIDCGLKDAQAVLDLIGQVERLAEHRARARAAGLDAGSAPAGSAAPSTALPDAHGAVAR